MATIIKPLLNSKINGFFSLVCQKHRVLFLNKKFLEWEQSVVSDPNTGNNSLNFQHLFSKIFIKKLLLLMSCVSAAEVGFITLLQEKLQVYLGV